MKLSLITILASAALSTLSSAFAPAPLCFGRTAGAFGSAASATAAGAGARHQNNALLRLGAAGESASDFISAMPEKPQIPMQERLLGSAKDFVESIRQNLAQGVEEPPEVAELEAAIESGSPSELAKGIYVLMIEQGMLYDQDPDTGTLTPTEFNNIQDMLDVPEVKQEFLYLYNYGMKLIQNLLVDVDDMKDIVKDRLIARTGLEPEAFDEWLGF